MPVEVKASDTRSIQVPVPASREDSAAFADFIFQAQSEGYVLQGATAIDGGSQRDPYTVGIRLTYAK